MDVPVSIVVQDQGHSRHVTIFGPHYVMGQRREYGEFESHYSKELLERLGRLKGGHLRDEILRLEDPAYIETPLREMLNHFGVDLTGKRVLDCGSGVGASSILLSGLGAEQVDGIDVLGECVQAARQRVAEEGLSGSITFQLLMAGDSIPLPDATYDVVMANALIEHIPPQSRAGFLREWWRLLRPGGYLLIRDTPNSLWPKDGHTTGLWWVPYMPLGMARRYAIARSPRVDEADSVEDLIVGGISGASYWEIAIPLKGWGLVEMNRRLGGDVQAYFRLSLAQAGEGGAKQALKRAVRDGLSLLERWLLKPLGIPGAALLPYLTLCFQKDERLALGQT
jgi:2-polyprenyl-3-methyl-5-hydroxy-6-metoxy-1,4-benzoquinol methylase